ncbi:MAG: TolC family protein, partial [Pirellulales bacterium]
ITEETLARNLTLRRQKWQIKRRELELIAAKNLLMPRLDLTGTYRFVGLGDTLFGANRTPFNPDDPLALTGSSALQTLATGQFQEWTLGAQMTMPIGFRKELTTVRHFQLQLAKERAKLQDLELELSHELADAIRNLELTYELTQTNFNRTLAAVRQVEAVQAAFDAQTVTLDQLLEAQRRRAEAQASFFRTLLDYQRAIIMVHFRKGSLLEYNNVYLNEGPWPAKAKFDAHQRARSRDAAWYVDYGFTRPAVMSQGAINQGTDGQGYTGEMRPAATPSMGVPTKAQPEELPIPTTDELPSPETSVPARESVTEHASPAPQAAVAASPSGFDWGSLGLDADVRSSNAVASAVQSSLADGMKGNAGPATARPLPVANAAASRLVSPAANKSESDGTVKRAKHQQWKTASDHESVENQPAGAVVGTAAGWQGQ